MKTRSNFGEERLIAALRRHRELAAREMLAAVVREVQQFSPQEQQDDITLIGPSAETDCARTRMPTDANGQIPSKQN